MSGSRLDARRVDGSRWVWVPPRWPVPGSEGEFPDAAAYARVMAEAHWEDSALTPGPGEVRELAEALTYGMERYPRVYPGYGLHFHLDGPRGNPLAVYWAEFDIEGELPGELRELTHADAEYAVEPPIVEDFGSEHLGTGIRVMRYFVDPDDNDITIGLRYAWRVPEHGADVLVMTAAPDPGRVLRAMDDIDAFARALHFGP
ncbi:hypothetical protein ACIOC1_23000 [Streptomyces sp. NPDC088197]|uniref:hypothetical protein n=1 Tax=Streptomyces sp. NPDC088197 TaxID=3365840 RepID=UPI00382FDA14